VTLQPTTTELVASLLEERSLCSIAPLVQLKEGEQQPPVFLAHGIGGNAMDFSGLVKHIRLSHPIYAMQATGNDGIREPLRSIEEMARVYLEAIKRIQPQGPYLLIGYSLGGLVSLEIAQRLSRNGDRVALLALVDSYPHWYKLSTGQRVRLLRRLVQRRVSSLLQWTRKGKPGAEGRRAARSNLSTYSASSPALRRVRRGARIALRRYRPQLYEGSISFIKAEVPTKFPDNPVAVWAHLAAEFEVEAVPGDHVTMLSKHSEALASVLTTKLAASSLRVPR
jgi:acetoacetyl-CoA synthetase